MKPERSNPQDFAVREIGASRPRLRPDLDFSIQEFRGERCCVVEDSGSGQFHRVGLREYYFIRLLDGTRTVEQAQSKMAGESREEALSEQEVTSVLKWLLETGLAVTDESTRADLMFERVEKKRGQEIQRFSNLLFFRQRLGNPDRLLNRLYGFTGWITGPVGLIAWLALVVTASVLIGLHWDSFVSDSGGVLASSNWLWLLLVWFFLKVLHELSHGLVCKRYGGQVPEAGLLFVLFAPLGYVDATSSWRLTSKWKRMHVSAAGMWAELGLAAIAVIIWANAEPGITRSVAYNVIIMATVVTFLFNANPLLKFDGYYILADLVEIPNLYQKGQQSLTQAARRYLVGIEAIPAPDWKDPESVFILAYGLAALIWRVLVLAVIVTAASFLFGGGGLVLALVSLSLMVGKALHGMVKYLREGRPGERPDPRIYLPRIALIMAVIGLVLLFPFRPTLTAPGVTDFGDASIVRVECPGFVQAVHVTREARVRKGDPILTLSNPEEEAQLIRLRNQLRQAQIRARNYQSEGNITGAQIETRKAQSLQKQLQEQEKFTDSLVLKAPSEGRVVGRHLDNLAGTYLRTGTEVATVEQRRLREVEIAIPQPDIELYREHQKHPVSVKIRGRAGTFYGLMDAPDPKATRSLPHPAFAGATGGPLPVRMKETTEGSAGGNSDPTATMELIRPVFTAKIQIKERLEENLRSGESAIVKFKSRQSRPLWKRVYQAIGAYMDHLSRTAQERAG